MPMTGLQVGPSSQKSRLLLARVRSRPASVETPVQRVPMPNLQKTRRAFLRDLGVAAAAFGLRHWALSAAEQKSLNFIFVLIDDMGWADTACYGSRFYETPNIDRLTAQGTRFTNAYAAAPVCSPTRASIMTGKYPARLHLTDYIPGENASRKLKAVAFEQQLPLSEVTIAEALHAAGYVTAHIGKWHLGSDPYYPNRQGFEINIAGNDWGHPHKGIFWHYPHYHSSGHRPSGAIRAGDFKLIEFFEDMHVELYNLTDDLSEKNDLAGSLASKASELRAALQDWRQRVKAAMPEPNPDF